MLKKALANWKTTSAGLTAITLGVVHLGYAIHAGGVTEAHVEATVASILAGVGLLVAGDAGAAAPTQNAERRAQNDSNSVQTPGPN